MKHSTTIALPLALLSALASAKDVTFRPAGNQEEWNGWTESASAANFVDGHLPAAGDVVTLSAEGHAVLPRHLKFLCMNWPANVGAGLGGAGFGLVGDATWVHEVRNLFVDEKAYSFLSSPHFFGWWRFCRADTVTFAPAGTDTTAVVQRLEASGRVMLHVDAGKELVVSNLFGAGTVRKVGAGDLEVVRTGGAFVNLEAQGGGTVVLHEQEKGAGIDLDAVLARARVRFDASDPGNFEFDAAGRISKWKASAPNAHYSATVFTTNKYGSATGLDGANAPLPRYVAAYSRTKLGVVDFGPYRATTDADLETSGAAALQFVEARANFAEAFIVFGDNDPLCRQCVFSESHNDSFPRGDYNRAKTYDGGRNLIPRTGAILNSGAATRGARDVRVNGRLVPSTFPVGGKNLKVVSIDCAKDGNAQSPESTIGAFARRGRTHIGGVVVAEFIGFTSPLADAERQCVNTYLMRKWLGRDACAAPDLNHLALSDETALSVPEGENVKVNQLTTGARLAKTGAGRLDVLGICGRAATGAVSVDVQEGAVAFRKGPAPAADAAPAPNPLYHFDVGDAASLTVVNEGGTNFVTEIRDQNDGTHAAVPMTADRLELRERNAEPPVPTSPARPFLSGTLNGRPVLSLGERLDPNAITNGGYGSAAALVLPSADATPGSGNVFEGFAVVKGKYCIYPFGSTIATTIYPDRYHILHRRFSLQMRSGEWTVNGLPVNPFEYAFDTAGTYGAFVVLRFSATDRTHVNAIGIQDAHPHGIGGVEFGEWIVYDRRLSEQERRDTEAYLMKKWLNADHPYAREPQIASVRFAAGVDARLETDVDLSVPDVAAASSGLTKAGAGRLTTVLPPNATALTVAEGACVLAPRASMTMSQALVHLDAADGSTFEYDTSNPAKVVRWKDVRGAGHPCAERDLARYADAPTRLDGAQNGLPVVDFGATTTWGVADGDKTAYDNYPNAGKALCFDRDLLVREGFLVLKSSAYSPILGGWDVWHFHPDATHLINVSQDTDHSLSCLKRACTWRVDDDPIDIWTYTWADYAAAGTGYHVISFAITNDFSTVRPGVNCARVQTLCADRAYVAGGKKYGEVVLFDRSLGADERAAVRQALVRKWNTADIGAAAPPTLASLTLGDRAAVALGPVAAVGHFAASGAGAVEGGLRLAENAVVDAAYRGADGATAVDVAGTLTLPAAASVVLAVDASLKPPKGAFVDLFTADAVAGSAARWAPVAFRDALGNPHPSGAAALSVVTLPNGRQALRATFLARGLYIILK